MKEEDIPQDNKEETRFKWEHLDEEGAFPPADILRRWTVAKQKLFRYEE